MSLQEIQECRMREGSPSLLNRLIMSYIIEKVRIVNVKEFARKIVNGLPSLDECPDSDGEIYDSRAFSIEIDGMYIDGVYSVSGRSAVSIRGNYFRQTEYSETSGRSIDSMSFWIDGDEVEIDCKDELEKQIKRLL